jgi:hypothetical protein
MTHVPGAVAEAPPAAAAKRPIAVVQELRAERARREEPPPGKTAARSVLARPPYVSLGQLLRVTVLLLVGMAWLDPSSLSNAKGSATPPAAAPRR